MVSISSVYYNYSQNMISQTLEDAKRMLEAFKLKFTYRYTDRPVYKNERESVAAHTW